MDEKKRDSRIAGGMARLEKLAAESEELVTQVNSAFGAVIFSEDEPSENCPCDTSSFSDLGSSLMRCCEKIDDNFARIRRLAESSDL